MTKGKLKGSLNIPKYYSEKKPLFSNLLDLNCSSKKILGRTLLLNRRCLYYLESLEMVLTSRKPWKNARNSTVPRTRGKISYSFDVREKLLASDLTPFFQDKPFRFFSSRRQSIFCLCRGRYFPPLSPYEKDLLIFV